MAKLSYLLNIVLIGFIGVMAYKFVYDGNVATGKDERTSVIVTAAEKAKVLGEMRGMLEGVQATLDAIANDELDTLPDTLKPLGMAAAANESPQFMAKVPLEMKTMGMDMHKAWDELRNMAVDMGDKDMLIEQLSQNLLTCTTCHASYRFVAEEEMN